MPRPLTRLRDLDPNPNPGHGTIDRSTFSALDVVRDIWATLKLPPHALEALDLPGADHSGPALPSSFKIGILAQSSIALAALGAALLHAPRSPDDSPPRPEGLQQRVARVPRVTVPLDRAVLEFRSEQLYSIEGSAAESAWGTIGGLHKTSDGHVRIHDVFPHHARGVLELLGLPPTATREDVARATARWRALDLEEQATHRGRLAVYAVRSYAEWDATAQASAVSDEPILLRHIDVRRADATGPVARHPRGPWGQTRDVRAPPRCLEGVRVLEMSRVIAAPVAGRVLAAHGADVLWVTSPGLPAIPALDRDLGRGKRAAHLDLDDAADLATLRRLLASCDVFLQGYRPGSLAARGLSPEDLARANPGIVVANLSAFGPAGPWAARRGFDSLVQACSGLAVSEAAHAAGGGGQAPRAMPCQALDHASGHLLAAGVMAALHRRREERGRGGGGAYVVDVSLAGTMKYLRSLGQYPGRSGFEAAGFMTPSSASLSDPAAPAAAAAGGGARSQMRAFAMPETVGDVAAEFLEERDTAFGRMKGVRHSAEVEGCDVGWERGPSVPGSDEPQWLLDA